MAVKKYRYINIFLIKPNLLIKDFKDLLAEDCLVDEYELDPQWNIDGKIYVKQSFAKRPKWAEMLDQITGKKVDGLETKSSSSVMFMKSDGKTFAITFGYGRFLINLAHCIQDFGIKTALNTLDHKSLRSVDLHTLEDQPIQKKSQATRESEASIFGIDISKDILRSVTGSPRSTVELKNISGGDAMYSFGVDLDINELPHLIKKISEYYAIDAYKNEFGWVDNVRRVKDKALLTKLDGEILESIKNKNNDLILTLPEIGKWDTISGFSFTRAKTSISPTIEADHYFKTISKDKLTIESIKKDRLFVHDVYGMEHEHSIYKCAYLELSVGDKTFIFYCGTWYQVDNTFIGRIQETLNRIEEAAIVFPPIEKWQEDGKFKIEPEGDYNSRVSKSHGYHLLDKNLIKSNKTTTSIELCDLLTDEKQFIHVKHRKGGSAGLSHLFAQGSVAAEIMLGDKPFRKVARSVLKKIKDGAQDLIPLDKLKSNECEIIFLILGDDPSKVKSNLPFFSKVNLARAYENLSQRGFSVRISAAETLERAVA